MPVMESAEGQRNLTCTLCSTRCLMRVRFQGSRVLSLSGNHCTRGHYYAADELRDPPRLLRGDVRVRGMADPLPVRTSGKLPRSLHANLRAMLEGMELVGPIAEGQLLACDLFGSGIDLVADRAVAARLPENNLNLPDRSEMTDH